MNRKGFTLIELLIVVAIISILAGIVLVGLRPSLNTSRDARRAAELRQIQTALQLYYNRYGSYPDALADLSGIAGNIPNDPSGSAYYYSYDSTQNKYWVGAKLEGGRSNSLEAGHANDGTGLASPDAEPATIDCNSADQDVYCLSF